MQRDDLITLVANDVGGVGGMERQLEQLVRGLLSAGHEVVVIARTCRVEPLEHLTFIKVPGPARPFSIGFPAFFVVASLLAARHRGPVLHTTGAIIANRAHVSTVHYCHAAATKMLESPRSSRSNLLYRLNARFAGSLSRAAERWCYRPTRTEVLSAVSRGLASELRNAFPRVAARVRVVANGVDVGEFRPDAAARGGVRSGLGIRDDALVALFVGGDWERKGIAFVVSALARAAEWQLIVVGAGDSDRIRRLADGLGVTDRLHLVGAVADTAPMYAAADAFVLPTAYETFSLVTYEAAASQLALLVTRVNGVEDLLRDGTNGWFINRDAADIAARLDALAADRNLMREMGLRAREDALAFSWTGMVSEYEECYRQVANAER